MPFNPFKTLRVKWSKKEKDWMIDYPTSATGHMTNGFIEGRIGYKEFVKELKLRGYNTNTLKITVDKREFKCIQDYIKDGKILFSKADVVYMKSDEEEGIALTNKERYSYWFSKNKKEENFFGNYFEEII